MTRHVVPIGNVSSRGDGDVAVLERGLTGAGAGAGSGSLSINVGTDANVNIDVDIRPGRPRRH